MEEVDLRVRLGLTPGSPDRREPSGTWPRRCGDWRGSPRIAGVMTSSAADCVHAAADAVTERLLDEAVLAAVEADDPDAAARTQAVGGDAQQLAQGAKLVVDQDAQGLERAGGGVQGAGLRRRGCC